jgi:hypothetical protein
LRMISAISKHGMIIGNYDINNIPEMMVRIPSPNKHIKYPNDGLCFTETRAWISDLQQSGFRMLYDFFKRVLQTYYKCVNDERYKLRMLSYLASLAR